MVVSAVRMLPGSARPGLLENNRKLCQDGHAVSDPRVVSVGMGPPANAQGPPILDATTKTRRPLAWAEKALLSTT